MSTTLSAAQRLKFQLLAEGIEISPLARKALREATSQSDLTPADYASTTGLILELDDDVWVNAPINDHNPNFVSGSRFVLDYGVDGLCVHGAGLASPARFWPPPRYHGQSGRFGPLNHFVVTHGDRARLSPVRGCAMTCTFCNIPYDDPLDVYGTKPIDALLEAARIAIGDERQPAHHMLISGGTPKRPDFGFMQELYRRVLPGVPADTTGRHHDGAAARPARPAAAGQAGPERDLDQHRGVQRNARQTGHAPQVQPGAGLLPGLHRAGRPRCWARAASARC